MITVPVQGWVMSWTKGTTINHLGGGVVQIEKKKFVRRYGEKKKNEQRVPEKKKITNSINEGPLLLKNFRASHPCTKIEGVTPPGHD